MKIGVVLGMLLLLISGVTQAQERLQVTASFSILADVARNVAGDVADVESIIPLGADPHTYSPTPADIAKVADADVVLVNGVGFEEGLLEAIENAASEVNLIVASSCIEILPIGATRHDHEEGEAHSEEESHSEEEVELDPLMVARCEAHLLELDLLHDLDHEASATEEADDHDHEHGKIESLGRLYEIECGEHGHEEEEADHAEDEHSHEEGACDEHVWSDPHNVIYWVLMIRDSLIAADSANAATYTANAAAYITELEELSHDFVEPMLESVPVENRVLVTNHETIGYLAAAYGYEIVGAIMPGGSTLAEPSASDLAALIDLVKEEGVIAIFAENTVNAETAQQVAAESGASFYTLYTDSLGEPGGEAGTYLDYIRYNVTTITQALGGGM
ncbi:MAG: zinc ABC transporter substrate-binding protein [Anaerolineae bacterium]|nr:zinc ABC transporter substrate-binding protein [Anaerolineae bacterium]